jgi:hypothetical protein
LTEPELTLLGMTLACGAQHHAFPYLTGAQIERVTYEVNSMSGPAGVLVHELETLVRQAVAAGRH